MKLITGSRFRWLRRYTTGDLAKAIRSERRRLRRMLSKEHSRGMTATQMARTSRVSRKRSSGRHDWAVNEARRIEVQLRLRRQIRQNLADWEALEALFCRVVL